MLEIHGSGKAPLRRGNLGKELSEVSKAILTEGRITLGSGNRQQPKVLRLDHCNSFS